jgi:hypothetical protein
MKLCSFAKNAFYIDSEQKVFSVRELWYVIVTRIIANFSQEMELSFSCIFCSKWKIVNNGQSFVILPLRRYDTQHNSK